MFQGLPRCVLSELPSVVNGSTSLGPHSFSLPGGHIAPTPSVFQDSEQKSYSHLLTRKWRTRRTELSMPSPAAQAVSCVRAASLKTVSEWQRWCRYGTTCVGLRAGNGCVSLHPILQSPFFDGKQPNWFHFSCFFKQCQPHSTVEVSGFGGLRPADQDRLRSKIQGLTAL